MSLLSQLLNVPSTDPGDARRRRLLNILLVGIAVLMLLLVLVTAIASMAGVLEREYTGILLLLRASLVGLAGVAVIFLVNRRVSGWLDEVVLKALAKRAEERYGSVDELRAALVREEPTRAQAPPPAAAGGPPTGR